jgi:hypothetical protein
VAQDEHTPIAAARALADACLPDDLIPGRRKGPFTIPIQLLTTELI